MKYEISSIKQQAFTLRMLGYTVADAPVALTVISTSAFLFSKDFSVLKWLNTLIIIFIFPVVRVLPFIAYLPDLEDSKTSRITGSPKKITQV